MTHGPPTRGHMRAAGVGESRGREESQEWVEDSSFPGEDGMQFAFGKDMSAMADEMHNFYEDEDLYTFEMGSTPSLDQESYSGIPGEDDLVLVTKDNLEKRLAAAQNNQAYVSPQELGGGRDAKPTDSAAQRDNRWRTSEMGTQSSGVGRAKTAHSIGVGESVDMSEAGVQSSMQALMHSTGTQGSAGYSDSFEQDVLSRLQAMNDRMANMKLNPTVTQNEIKQQELMQQQLIQNTIGMSLNNPDVMKNLLAMLKEQLQGGSKSTSSSQRSSTAFDDLQAKLLLAQEQQRQDTRKHFETQAEFQEYMKKQMEEQSKLQMMGIQSNFEMYSKKMLEQFAEQQKRLDEELRKRREREGKSEKKRKRSKDQRNKKKPRKRKSSRSSNSSLSDSDEGLVLQATRPNRPRAVNFPAIKTMQARIFTQDMLEDDMKTESQVSIAKIKEKQEARGKLTRMDTTMKFDNASAALRRYESTNPAAYTEEGSSDNDPDDEGMIHVQTVRPVTLKRAEIKTQSDSGFTPARPAPPPPEGKVGRIRRIESGSEADQPLDQHSTEGAGNELQAALKKRWKK